MSRASFFCPDFDNFTTPSKFTIILRRSKYYPFRILLSLFCILGIGCTTTFSQSPSALYDKITCFNHVEFDSIAKSDSWKNIENDTILFALAKGLFAGDNTRLAREIIDSITVRNSVSEFPISARIQEAFFTKSNSPLDAIEQMVPATSNNKDLIIGIVNQVKGLNNLSAKAYFSSQDSSQDTLRNEKPHPLLYNIQIYMLQAAAKQYSEEGKLSEGLSLSHLAENWTKLCYPPCHSANYQAAISLGRRYINSDQPERALNYFRAAHNYVSQYESGLGFTSFQAKYNMADALEGIGEIDSSELFYQQALNSLPLDNPKNIKHRVGTYINLASIYTNKGLIDQAQEYYLKAIAAADAESDKPTVGRLVAYANVATSLGTLGQLDKSIELLEKAKSMSLELVGSRHLYTAIIMMKIGQVYYQNDACSSCEQYFIKSLAIRKELYGENHSSVANVYTNLALINDDKRLFQEALLYMNHAVSIYENTLGNAGNTLAQALNRRAKIHIHAGNTTAASNDIQSALAAINCTDEETRCPRDQLLLELIEKKARVILFTASTEKELLEALRHCQDAYEIFKIIFDRAESLDDNARIVDANQRFFLTYLKTLVRLYEFSSNNKWLKKALQLNAIAKQTKLFQQYREQNEFINSNIPFQLRQERKKLTNSIKTLENKLLVEKTTNISAADTDSLAMLIRQAHQVAAQINNLNPKMAYLTRTPDSLNFQQIQQSMTENDAIIDFSLIDSSLIAFIITKNNVDFSISRMDTSMVDNITSWLPTPNNSISPDIENAIVKPFAKLPSSIQNIKIIPNELIANIPFEMLTLEGVPLFDRYTFSYANSLHIHALQGKRHESKADGVAIIAPSYVFDKQENNTSTLALPASRDEVVHIQHIYDADLIKDNDANKKNFLNALQNYDILHISSHAQIDEKFPLNSRFILGAKDNSADDVALHDLLGIASNTQLAVLSACETGRGSFIKGADVKSLSNGFQFAGVPSVVLSLWKVPDYSTSIIMRAFHENVKNGEALDVSLHKAQRSYLAQAESKALQHPHYWAGFIVVGDTSPIQQLPWHSSGMFIGLGLAALIAVIAYFFRASKRQIH